MVHKEPISNRLKFLKAAAGVTLGSSIMSSQQALSAKQVSEDERHIIKAAGYDYDRVLAIMDGRVGIKNAEISFDTKNTYAVSNEAFGLVRNMTSPKSA